MADLEVLPSLTRRSVRRRSVRRRSVRDLLEYVISWAFVMICVNLGSRRTP